MNARTTLTMTGTPLPVPVALVTLPRLSVTVKAIKTAAIAKPVKTSVVVMQA